MQQMTDDDATKIPVVIITGFLGSGKTTLLNFLVKQPDLKSTAVIINEFGEIGIDHLLVETSSEKMIEINNGCICCTIRGDLQDKLGSLAMWLDTGRLPPVDRVIVETTGLADPAPIMHTLMTDEHLLNRYRLSGVVTLIDAITGLSSLNRFPEAVKQIAIADQLIFSKTDLVDSLSDRDSYVKLRKRVKEINSRAIIHDVVKGEIDASTLLRQEINESERAIDDIRVWSRSAVEIPDANAHIHDTARCDIKTFAIELAKPVDRDQFNEFLQALAIEFGENLLRMKGILHVIDRPEQPAVIHGVQHVFFPILWLDEWPSKERTSTLVFITQGLEPAIIQARFNETFADYL
ncbi:MAG: G3E family GTPase [Woeseiaceae bacterium]|jgi:G3E family GTPase